MNNKRVTITVETDSLLLIRRRRASEPRTWCQRCRTLVDFASLEDALILTSRDSEALTYLINDQTLHAIKAPQDSVVICFPSILNFVGSAR